MRKDVLKCPECERITPKRHPSCVYCAAVLRRGPAVDDVFEPRMLGGKSRFTRKSDERGHYLLLPTGQPIELEPGNRFVMGRDPRASLVFHTEDISRQHAELTWEGDPPTPLIGEVRSRNGTYLTNKRVKSNAPQPLRSGDEFRLGSSVRVAYLHLTERDLRKELETRAGSDTRSFDVSAFSTEASAKSDTRVLGDLVAAALGEAELTPLEEAGDFTDVSGSVLVKRLYSEQKSGVLTVYDGTAIGELHLIDGRCQHAILGVLAGRDALRHVASLDVGQFRFFPEPSDVIADLPAPTEVDEAGLALSGELADTPGSSLVRDLVARKATGVLTLFDSLGQTGWLVLESGVCQEVRLGAAREREALDAVVRLRAGVFRFRPREPSGTAPLLSAGAWNEPIPGTDRASTRMPRGPLRAPPTEESVKRRSTTPMRAPPESSRHTRRQRPPLPKRRNPPPRPY